LFNKKILVLLLIGSINFVDAQPLPDRKVFSTAGKILKNSYVLAPASQQRVITFTMGEPIIGLWSFSGKRLFNGFIQSDAIVPVSPPGPVLLTPNDPFSVVPNPTNTFINITAPSDWDSRVYIQVIDLNGKLIKQLDMQDKLLRMDWEENNVPGNYFLNFYQENGQFIQQTKLIKLNKQ
jgi:hypothetical protein